LNKAVNILLEWFFDALMKLQFPDMMKNQKHCNIWKINISMSKRLMYFQNMNMSSNILLPGLQIFGRVVQERDQQRRFNGPGSSILEKAHPGAVLSVIHHLITVVQSRWEEGLAK
jgi:hypothetical protein